MTCPNEAVVTPVHPSMPPTSDVAAAPVAQTAVTATSRVPMLNSEGWLDWPPAFDAAFAEFTVVLREGARAGGDGVRS